MPKNRPGAAGAPSSTATCLKGSSSDSNSTSLGQAKGRAFLPALIFAKSPPSGFQNRHDLVGVWIHDHDLLLDEDELIPAPFRIDRHHALWQRMEGHVARYAGANRNREVHVRHRRNALLVDHAGDLGALLGRELRGRAGLARGGRALAGGSALSLGLRLRAVLLTLGLLVTVLHLVTILRLIATLRRGLVTMLRRALITLHRALAGGLSLFGLLFGLLLGLHAAAVFLAFGLHVLAAL